MRPKQIFVQKSSLREQPIVWIDEGGRTYNNPTKSSLRRLEMLTYRPGIKVRLVTAAWHGMTVVIHRS